MQNELAEQDDFISLKDIAKIIIKRKKMLLWTTVVLFLLSIVAIFVIHQNNKVIYQQTVTLPYYYSGATQEPVLDMMQVIGFINSQVLPNYLETVKDAQLAAGKPMLVNTVNYKVAPIILQQKENDGAKPAVLSPLVINLTYTAKRSDESLHVFNTTNNALQLALQDYMKPRLSSYITDANNNISQLEYQIPVLEKDKEIEQGAKQNNSQTSDVNIQTMRDLYLAAISDKDQYNMLFKAQVALVTAKKQLQSLHKNLTIGKVVVSPDLKQHSRLVLLILSLFISLFIGFIAVFIAEFTANLNDER